MSQSTPTTAAVLPVRGHGAFLDGALDCLRRQSQPIDEIIVVDDTVEGAMVPIRGVSLLNSYGRGPYAARNVGWRSSTADIVFFLDARSRPRPDWAAHMLRGFEEPSTALMTSAIAIMDGESLASRVSRRLRFFNLETTVDTPSFRAHAPTCNLAARRRELERVDGFHEVRSGGDVDLCWRVQQDPGHHLEAVREPLMDWLPRDRVRDLLEQNYRYGRNNVRLRTAWRSRGAEVAAPPLGVGRQFLRITKHLLLLALGLAIRNDEKAEKSLEDLSFMAYLAGYRLEYEKTRTERSQSLQS